MSPGDEDVNDGGMFVTTWEEIETGLSGISRALRGQMKARFSMILKLLLKSMV